MILNSENANDMNEMMLYGKTKGMILVKKFFPEFFIYDRIIIFQTIDDWNKIANQLSNIFFLRADTKIKNKKGVYVVGRWSNKQHVKEFVSEVNKQNSKAVIVYLEEKILNQDELIYTQAAFNIHFDLNKYIYIDYVCPCFDASDITRGKATHQSWKIPFDEIAFLTSKTINKYNTFTISDEAYQDSWKARKIKMFSEHPNRVEEIKNIDNKFVKCPNSILDLIIDKIILSIYIRINDLKIYVGNEFGVQFNITGIDTIEVYEINRPERIK